MIIMLEVASILHQKIPPSDKNLRRDKWEVQEETTVAEVLEMLNLGHIPVILMLNGRQGQRDTILKENDVLKIFSAVSGG